MRIRDYALDAYDAGFTPLPPRHDGNKSPGLPTWAQYQDERPARSLVADWFHDRIEGIGFLCGRASGGLVMFEFEGIAVEQGLDRQFLEQLKHLGHQDIAELLQSWIEQSPSGGLHLHWRCPDHIINNLKLAFTVEGQVLIETRGEGGYTVAAPSGGRVHKHGKRWRRRKGTALTCPTLTAEQQQIVLDLARSFNQKVETAEPTLDTPTTTYVTGSSDIGDLIAKFNANEKWERILHGHFEWVGGPDRDGVQRLKFIGQESGTGATLYHGGKDRLIVWSGTAAGKGWRTAGDGPAPTYDKFSAYVFIKHGSHSTEARMQVLRDELGLRTTDQLDEDLGINRLAEQSTRQRKEVQRAATAQLGPMFRRGWDSWPEVIPLEPEPEPPAFPIDVLPNWIREHVEHVAGQIQVPVDLPATTALGSLVSILTGRAKVQITSFWTEPVNLFQVVAMRSGSGKSPAVNQTVDWVYDLETTLEQDAAEDVRKHEEKVRITQDELQRARKAAAAGKQEEGAKTVHDLRTELETAKQNLEDARSPRLVVQDATPEGLINVLAHNDGVSIISPEAELFDMVTRGKSTERASLDIYLKGFSGEPYIKDRKGSNEHGPEAIRIPHANLSVCCTVQPAVLDRLCTDELLANRGFAQRFMYACPADMVGHRNIDAQFASSQAATDARNKYDDKCCDFANDWLTTGKLVCTFSSEAVEAVKKFKKSLEPRLQHTADLANLAEWVSKLVSSVVRLAAVLHLIHGNGAADDISKATVDQAIKIGNYWLENAIILLAYRGDLHRQQTHHMLDWIKSRHPDSGLLISTAEFAKAKDGTGNRVARTRTLNLWDARDYIPALRTLEEHGYIVFEDEHWADKLGTKGSSKEFRLNPNIPGETEQE